MPSAAGSAFASAITACSPTGRSNAPVPWSIRWPCLAACASSASLPTGRRAFCVVGHVRPVGLLLSQHLAGEFLQSQIWLQEFSGRRPVDQLLVGVVAGLR